MRGSGLAAGYFADAEKTNSAFIQNPLCPDYRDILYRTGDMAVQREDGSWLMDGSIPIPELKDRLGLQNLPAEDKGYYTILSGMFMYLTGRIPREGDHVTWQGWRFEVVDMDGNMIDKILAEKLPGEAPAGTES